MKKRGWYLGIWAMCCLLGITSAWACTDFRLTAQDGTVLVTRSMEFGADMNSNLRTSTRGRSFTNTAPNGKPGLSWKAKYGYVFLDAFQVDTALDGLNEAGLSIENLYLPGYAEYQSVPAGKEAQSLPYLSFADWVLGNFKSIDEVKSALSKVFVFTQAINVQGHANLVFPLHFSIFDASGKGIVVEYVKGQLHVYDHLGIMTNSPTYDWHLKNILNYVGLTPLNPPAVIVKGITYRVDGQGFGMMGLPGDISPPSRFVRIATLMRVAFPMSSIQSELNLAQHIINNVDIPLGLAREPGSDEASGELTQWVVFKDLTHKIFYYRSYGDMTLRSVSLSALDFSENAARLKMPIARPAYVDDLTPQFLQSKNASTAVPVMTTAANG